MVYVHYLLPVILLSIILVSSFSISAFTETTKECENRIRADDSKTYAEKTVALKQCDNEERDYDPQYDPNDTPIDDNFIDFCNQYYEMYKMIGADQLLRMSESGGASTVMDCITAYQYSEWENPDKQHDILLAIVESKTEVPKLTLEVSLNDQVFLLKAEIVDLKKIIEQKDAVLMEQVKVINNLAQMMKGVIFNSISSILSYF